MLLERYWEAFKTSSLFLIGKNPLKVPPELVEQKMVVAS